MLIKIFLTAGLVLTTTTLYAQYSVNDVAGWGGGATVASSYAAGYADVVRAAGDFELNNSVAAGNYADARSKEIDNDVKGTQAYFQMREINRAGTQALEGRPLTREESYRIAKARAPKRTLSTQLDPVSGTINWPIILRAAPYQADLDKLDKLFAQRSVEGTLNGDQYAEVQKLHDDLVAILTANAKNYKDFDLIAAKNILDSLAFEARFPAG
jgi:hypothetical protein